MEKVKLPKEVAEAIESVVENYSDFPYAKHGYLTDWSELSRKSPHLYHTLFRYFTDNPIDYVTALVNGYEVEQTPEDKVREYYERMRKGYDEWDKSNHYANSGNPYSYEMQGVAKTLNLLGITIPGVNGGETE